MEIGQIIDDRAEAILARSSEAVLEGIETNILAELQFSNAAAAEEIGADLFEALPLSARRLSVKRALNAPLPELPRYLTGETALGSVPKQRGLIMEITPADDEKASRQQRGVESGWRDEFGALGGRVPPRPFFGVSRAVLEDVEQIVSDEGTRMEREFDTIVLPPIRQVYRSSN